MITAKRIMFAALGLVGLCVLGFVASRVASRGRFATAYSTYGGGAEGTRALFLLADALSARPSRWSEDLGRLPPGGMLVVLGGCDSYAAREPSRIEREALRKWIDAGGVLFVAGARDFLKGDLGVTLSRRANDCAPRYGLISALERAARDDKDGDEENNEEHQDGEKTLPTAREALTDPGSAAAQVEELTTASGLPASEWTKPSSEPLLGLAPIAVREPGVLEVGSRATATTLLEGDDGPIAVVVRRGRGRVIAFASASLFQNRELGASEGGVVFARVVKKYARTGPILFDEYHAGVGEKRSLVRYLGQIGVLPFALQLLAVCALLLWRAGSRLGPPITEPHAPPVGTASFVDAIGDLYRRTSDGPAALELLIRRALVKIAAFHHLPFAPHDVLSASLARHGRSDPAAAVSELGRLSTEAASVRTESALLHAARQIDLLVLRATSHAPSPRSAHPS